LWKKDYGLTTGDNRQLGTIGGQWYVLAAAVLWGTTGTAQALAPDSASPLAIGAVRMLIGGLFLLGLAAVRGKLSDPRLPLRPTVLSAVGVAGYQLCFFAGVARTGVAVGTVAAIGSAPIWTGFQEWLIYRQRPSSRWTAATVLAVAGAGLLLTSAGSLNLDGLGIFLSLVAGLCYALYAVASKPLLPGRSPDFVMAAVFSLSALFLLPLLFVEDLSWLGEPRGLAVAFQLGIVTTAVAYTLFARGLTTIPVATAVTLTLAEPLTAATLGVVVLGEQLTLLAWVGVSLLLVGLALLSLPRELLTGRTRPG
jgi:DME family drug/metabolite transporter